MGKDLTNGIWSGVWSADVSGVTNGSQYKFYFNKYLWKQDPRARLVTYSGSADGANSIVYDPNAFNWNNDSLTPPLQKDLVIYEMHIGTFYTNTLYSKFISATNKLDYLKSLGVNAVEGDLNNGVRLVTAIDSATPNSYYARKRSTLGATVTLTAPGVPMIFQGQEMLENQQFSSTRPVDWSKTTTYGGIVQLYRDLIGARRDLKGYTPGLEGDQCSMLWVDNISKVIAYHRWNSGTPNQDAVVIANFGNTNYPVYNLNFPSAGNWYVHFNSDSTNYSSDFGNNGSYVVTASGNPAMGSIAIGAYSALILSPTPEAPPQLTISPAGGTMTITWPNTYSEWVLDSSPTLSGIPAWNEVPPSQYMTNATSIFLDISQSQNAMFYRLRKP